MNSALKRMKSAAAETSEEIRNRALWTALRAMTVSSAERIAASANTQKKTASQPERIIVDFRCSIADFELRIADLKSEIRNSQSAILSLYTSQFRGLARVVRDSTRNPLASK